MKTSKFILILKIAMFVIFISGSFFIQYATVPVENHEIVWKDNGQEEKEISPKNLPTAVKKVIAKKFGKKIKFISILKITQNKKKAFKIHLKKNEDTYELITNSSGNILLLKKIIQFDSSEEEMGC
ncbi:hypothetical protein BMS3Abin04_02309 [bacterium BMS3Abin04]|nr:hypothetical protein BMS3Abin04_02309 [bacterium BMS3Abin04]